MEKYENGQLIQLLQLEHPILDGLGRGSRGVIENVDRNAGTVRVHWEGGKGHRTDLVVGKDLFLICPDYEVVGNASGFEPDERHSTELPIEAIGMFFRSFQIFILSMSSEPSQPAVAPKKRKVLEPSSMRTRESAGTRKKLKLASMYVNPFEIASN